MADTDRGYADDVAPDGSPFRPLYDGNILFNGQPIAVVVAEAWEIARFAASLVRVEYAKDAHVTDLDSERDNAFSLSDETFALAPAKPRGDAEKALAAAARAPRRRVLRRDRASQPDGAVRLHRDLARRRQAHGL